MYLRVSFKNILKSFGGEKSNILHTSQVLFPSIQASYSYLLKKTHSNQGNFFSQEVEEGERRERRGKRKISGMVRERKRKILNFQASLRHMRQVCLYFSGVLTENF